MKDHHNLIHAIQLYEESIKLGEQIFLDTCWHQFATEKLFKLLSDQKRIIEQKDSVLEDLKKYLIRSRAKSSLIRNIQNDYDKFVILVEYLKDENVPIEDRINNSLGKNSKYGIEQGNFFFITQLISGLYPEEYTISTDEIIESLIFFRIVNSNFKVKSVQSYIKFNTLCTELFKKFKNEYMFNLSYVHNFLWHYSGDYLRCGNWAVNVENAWYYNNSEWQTYAKKIKGRVNL